MCNHEARRRPDGHSLTNPGGRCTGRRSTALAISPFGVNEASIDVFHQGDVAVTLLKPHMNTAVLEVSDGFWQMVCKAWPIQKVDFRTSTFWIWLHSSN